MRFDSSAYDELYPRTEHHDEERNSSEEMIEEEEEEEEKEDGDSRHSELNLE
jgi:hypothetical protein